MTALARPLTSFRVSRSRWAAEPPEERGIPRDGVRLLVASPAGVEHVRFADLPRFLDPGDVVVVNTSATRAAALEGLLRATPVVVHLAGRRPERSWTVELRRDEGRAPLLHADVGDAITVTAGGVVTLRAPVAPGPGGEGVRLWRATLHLDGAVTAYLARHGRPVSYDGSRWPLDVYQTVFATRPGSAEMPSAGRPFSTRLVTELITAGVVVAPVTLHTGLSSQEAGEPPQPEWFEVPATTAAQVQLARGRGRRVVAVGTTVTRALESATDRNHVVPRRGWTDLVVTPETGVRVVSGLVSGWHEPDSSHLLVLEAVAGAELVNRAYQAAVDGPYLWHEFGDGCLLLP